MTNDRSIEASAASVERDPNLELSRLLQRALLALAKAGQTDQACRLAAEAWSMLRQATPLEAERYNALLHRLTAPKQSHRRDVHDPTSRT